MSEETDTSDNSESFENPVDALVKYNGRTYQLYITVEARPNLDNPEYWTVVLHFEKSYPEEDRVRSHNVAKIEEDRIHDGVHIHRLYRRDEQRDFDIDIEVWWDAMKYLEENHREFFESYAELNLD
jgi:hypothetical protein